MQGAALSDSQYVRQTTPSRAESSPAPLRITFVLPGRGRSGGVRVTVEMANRLLERGHHVRLACRALLPLSAAAIRSTLRRSLLNPARKRNNDWVNGFRGTVDSFRDLNRLSFTQDEVVIAVGTMTIEDVYRLQAPVKRVRYCHGFLTHEASLTDRAWRLPMPTISVSATLIPQLQDLTGNLDIPVIPNGVDLSQYYPDSSQRNGIGTIFSRHFLKAPDTTLLVLRAIRERWPQLPQYVFGEGRRPGDLPANSYWRYPSVEKARQLYSSSRIWLLFSRSEGLPGSLLEAMACGCAIVSTRQAGSIELVQDQVNGLLVPVDDQNAFMEKIDSLLHDESLCRRLAQAGRETAARFGWDRAVDKMEHFLHSVANESHPKPHR